MRFIVVANDDLAPLARQLAHALSIQKGHSGTFWTIKHYKDNEAQLDGKQPVVFLGDNDISKSYLDVLPERFSGFGTKCAYEGAKVALVADEPEKISRDDIVTLTRAVKGNQEELRRAAALAVQTSPAGAVGSAGASTLAVAVGAGWAAIVPIVGVAVLTARWIRGFMSARRRKREYAKLQYAYVLSRFLKDEFEAYIAGVEGH